MPSPGVLIAHNARRVEVGLDIENHHLNRLRWPPGGAIGQGDGRSVLRCRLASIHNRLPRLPIPHPHLPEIARAYGRQSSHAPVKKLAHRANVAVGPVGPAAFDAELATQRVERIRRKGKCAPGKDEGVDKVPDLEHHPRAAKLRFEKTNVPHGRMRHEDRAIEGGGHSIDQGRKGGGVRDVCGVDPMNVRVSSQALAGVHETMNERFPLTTGYPVNADLEHPIFRYVEPGHFQVDKGERRLGRREVPRRSGRGGSTG